jgi:hypothetical protein
MVLEPFGEKLLEELFDFDCSRVTRHPEVESEALGKLARNDRFPSGLPTIRPGSIGA